MILVTGVTGNVHQHIVSQLLGTSVPVRELGLNSDSAGLRGGVDVACGDLSVPETLDACLDESGAAFLDTVTKHTRRIVYLSSEEEGDDLIQQTDTITAQIATELAV